MARLYSCGFELQSLTARMEVGGITGSPTIDTATKHSGLASLRTNLAVSAAGVRYQFADSNLTEPIFYRFYMRIAIAPLLQDTIFRVQTTAAVVKITIRLNADNTLEFWNNEDNAQIGVDSSALSTDTWYYIEVKMDTTTLTSTAVEAKINGTAFASGTLNLAVGQAEIEVGSFTTTTVDLYFDDIAINDASGSTQTSYPGPGNIVHIYPNAAGDNNDAVSGDWDSINEVTPDDATTLAVLDADLDILDVNCESSTTAGIDSFDTITLVALGIREAALSGAAESWKLRIKSAASGTVAEGTTTTHNDVTYKTNGDFVDIMTSTLTSYTDPTTGVAWTPTGTNSIDNMQIGIQAVDATPDINVSTIWALVEYVDGTPPAGGGPDSPLSQNLTLMGVT